MKKQTKVMATLSTAALLALGFSAVSMAAGWDNSTGAWRYLNNDGTEVVDEWKSANGNWFYLDSDGVMATDKLIEDESGSKVKYYYVDQYGAMVKNTWKAVAMDDDDNTDLDAEYWWYYFGSDGKAYTTDSNKPLTKSKVKTINGLKYAFDEEGHMLYGWTLADDHTQNDDDNKRWEHATYYFNGWNDGHAQTGWAQIPVEDDDDETQNYWFYFNGDGEKQAGKRKKINGVYYVFADDGHMIDEWVLESKDASGNTIYGTDFATTSDAGKISYVNGDGAQRKNTWVYAIPDEKWITGDYDDDQYRWFYTDKSGNLINDVVKKINGKYYAFDSYGRMQTGFVQVIGGVDKIAAADDYSREQWILNNKLDGKNTPIYNADEDVYFFSTDEAKDGARKTGYQNIEMSDDTYQFYFQKNGEGKTQYDSKIKKYTIAGLILKPTNEDDNNYGVVELEKQDKVFVPVNVYTNYDESYKDSDETVKYVLVNKQGTVVKGKTIKDENDQYWKTNSDGVIINMAKDKDAYDAAKKATKESEKW